MASSSDSLYLFPKENFIPSGSHCFKDELPFFLRSMENQLIRSGPFFNPLYPPPREPKGVQLFLLMSYFVLGNVYWTLNLLAVLCLFGTLKMFYPPEGLCKADTERGPIVFNYVLFCVRKRILDF